MRYISLLFFAPAESIKRAEEEKRVFGRLEAWPGLEKTMPTGGESEGVKKRGGEEREKVAQIHKKRWERGKEEGRGRGRGRRAIQRGERRGGISTGYA